VEFYVGITCSNYLSLQVLLYYSRPQNSQAYSQEVQGFYALRQAMRPSYESVLQRRTYKNLRSIQRRSSKNMEGSSETGVLRLEDGWLDGEQPMETQEGERAMYHLYLKKLRSFKRLQEASTN
jgi:hypothetical protein